MASLKNRVYAAGQYGAETVTIDNFVDVELLDGLTITKTADKTLWAGGLLTYTTTITNVNATMPYENIKVDDKLDTSIVTFEPDSVYKDDTKLSSSDYTYDILTGELHIEPVTPITLAAGESVKLTFQITKNP